MKLRNIPLIMAILFAPFVAFAANGSHNGTYGTPYSQGFTATAADGNLNTQTITINVNGGGAQTINHIGTYTGFDVTAAGGSYSNDGTTTSTTTNWTSITTDPDGVTIPTGTGALGYFSTTKNITIVPKMAGSFVISSVATDGSYGDSTTVTDTLTITAQPIVIALSGTKVYDGTTALAGTEAAALGSGALAGDTITSISLTSKAAATYTTATGVVIKNSSNADVTALYSITYSGSTSVTTAPLTITGLTGVSRTYDRTNVATTSGTGSLVGVVSGDTVTLDSSTAVLTFANANIGTNKVITASGYKLAGADASNYSLTQPSALVASITAKNLTIAGVTATTRVYDRTTVATLSGGSLVGIISPDAVTLNSASAVGTFATKNVGSGIVVATTGYGLNGADAGNYSLTQPSITGTITAAPLTITGLNVSAKVYDGTTTGTVTGTEALSGVISPDVVSLSGTAVATFANANVGSWNVAISGLGLTGADAANYSLNALSFTRAITAAPTTVAVSPKTSTIELGQSVVFTVTGNTTSNIAWSGAASGTGTTTTVTPVAVGTFTVSVKDNGDSNHSASNTDSATITVTAKTDTIGNITANANIGVGDIVTVPATTVNGVAVTYAITSNGVNMPGTWTTATTFKITRLPQGGSKTSISVVVTSAGDTNDKPVTKTANFGVVLHSIASAITSIP